MIGETNKVLICMRLGEIVEVISEESGEKLNYKIIGNNDYIGENKE